MRLNLLLLLILAGCATPQPQLVMLNPRTGTTVGCALPDLRGNSGEFLVSRACLSACQAHGFRPVPGVLSKSSNGGTPQVCLD
jgi:hypothetical protein